MIKTEESELEQLKKHSLVVADTGDSTLIDQYQPEDSTTNPSLILQVAQKSDFADLLLMATKFGLKNFGHFCAPVTRSKKKVEASPVEWSEMSP